MVAENYVCEDLSFWVDVTEAETAGTRKIHKMFAVVFSLTVQKELFKPV